MLDGKLELTESVGNKWLAAAAAALRAVPGWSDRVHPDSGQCTLTGRAGRDRLLRLGIQRGVRHARHFNHPSSPARSPANTSAPIAHVQRAAGGLGHE